MYRITTSQGHDFLVNEAGNISRGGTEPSGQWNMLGVSTHHWHGHPTLDWPEIKAKCDRGETVRGYVWDVDHGTTRLWGGRKCDIWRSSPDA